MLSVIILLIVRLMNFAILSFSASPKSSVGGQQRSAGRPDDVATHARGNGGSVDASIRPSGSGDFLRSGEVWFRAAVIAVPIAGLVILGLLVLLAVRLLCGERSKTGSGGGVGSHCRRRRVVVADIISGADAASKLNLAAVAADVDCLHHHHHHYLVPGYNHLGHHSDVGLTNYGAGVGHHGDSCGGGGGSTVSWLSSSCIAAASTDDRSSSGVHASGTSSDRTPIFGAIFAPLAPSQGRMDQRCSEGDDPAAYEHLLFPTRHSRPHSPPPSCQRHAGIHRNRLESSSPIQQQDVIASSAPSRQGPRHHHQPPPEERHRACSSDVDRSPSEVESLLLNGCSEHINKGVVVEVVGGEYLTESKTGGGRCGNNYL